MTKQTKTQSYEVQPSAEHPVERTRERQVFQPAADIFENDREVVLVADMPGVDERSLEITLEGNVLKIVGRTQDPQMDGYSLRYAEFEAGDFERTFALSSRVDPERISASIKNGVMRLSVPKLQPAQKQIQVKAG
jgi:HSP20 family molecular chaperone IbpA